MPFALSSGRIEGHDGAGEKVVALADFPIHVGAGVASCPVKSVELGVVAARQPGGRAPQFPAIVFPGFVTKLTGARDGIETPDALAGGGVVSVYKAADAVLAPRNAYDDLVLDRERRNRDAVAFHRVGHLYFPKRAACPGIERDEGGIESAEKYAIPQHSNATIVAVTLKGIYDLLRTLVLPDLHARASVQRKHLAWHTGRVHDAVHYNRRCLEYGIARHLYGPFGL